MKKILFVIGSAELGGAEVGMLEIVKELHKKYDISICFYNATGSLLNRIPDNLKVFSVLKSSDNVIIRRIKRYLYYRGSKTLYKKIIKDKYDVEIAYLEGGPAMFVASSHNHNSRKISSIRVDITNHKLDVDIRVKNSKKAQRLLENAYKKFDIIYGVSNDTTKSFVNRFPSLREKTDTLYTYFDKNEYVKLGKEQFDKYNKTEFNIVSVGRFSAQKGYERLIEIAKRLKKDKLKFKWYIVGNCNGIYAEEIKSNIKNNNLEDVIKIEGQQINPYKYIYNADLLVSTSLYEGFPRVINESIALGTPVVAPKISGVSESILGLYGIASENNTLSLYKAVRSLIINPSKLKVFKQNIKSKKYDKKAFYDKFELMLKG